MPDELYTCGCYLEKHPTWHVEDSSWKATQIIRIMRQNGIVPKSLCEVGCGAGEILKQLQEHMTETCPLWGYEISPQAFELCNKKANEGLHFKLGDIRWETDVFFDVILLIDVIEHLEDYFSFLREIKPKSRYKILHIPLDLSVQAVLRSSPIIRARESVGHLHYFTKEIALRVLKDVGFEVLDWFYTAGATELPARSMRTRMARLPRKLLFSVHEDFAVRVLGGYSLMALAK